MIFIYDGTFEGFLSAVFDAYEMKIEPTDIVSSNNVQMNFDSNHTVKTTEEKSDRVMAGMERYGFANIVIFAFLSCCENKEIAIYKYIVMGFKMKDKILQNLGDDIVCKVNSMCSLTGNEKVKLKGFIRFSILEENNIHYAEISPKHNVLTLIMPHFTRRISTIPFLINDLTYKQVGLYDTKEWHIRSSEGLAVLELRSDELNVRQAWKLFYDTIAVENRINKKRRQQMMPKRYHKHITEMTEKPFSEENVKSTAVEINSITNLMMLK